MAPTYFLSCKPALEDVRLFVVKDSCLNALIHCLFPLYPYCRLGGIYNGSTFCASFYLSAKDLFSCVDQERTLAWRVLFWRQIDYTLIERYLGRGNLTEIQNEIVQVKYQAFPTMCASDRIWKILKHSLYRRKYSQL